jgi:hypothetical protein
MARTHTYVCNKGYADKYKGREVKWQVGETVAESIERGEFPDEKTLVRAAQAQLNIKRGHAIQAATVEKTKDAEGKETDVLVNPDLSLADMEKIAAETVMTASSVTRTPGGGQKVAAQKFTSAKEKIAAKLATATEEQIADWLDLGLIDEAQAAGRRAELANAKGGRRPGR